jgi:histone H3/H4
MVRGKRHEPLLEHLSLNFGLDNKCRTEIMPEISPVTLRRLIRENAPNIRVSESAMIELQAILETDGEGVARLAVELARRRGAKTVVGADVRKVAAEHLSRP